VTVPTRRVFVQSVRVETGKEASVTEDMMDNTDLAGPAPFAARADEWDGTVVVSLVGELDMATVSSAALVLRDAVARGKPIVVDMTGLRFFSSAGLTLLAQLNEARRNPPLDVRLVGDQRVVIRPLELTGLRDLFPIHRSLDDALAAIR
jgi:anti-anti-sigma factor